MKKKILSLLSTLLLLTGCNKTLALEFVPFDEYVEPQNLLVDYEDEFFYQKKETIPVSNIDGFDKVNTLDDLMTNYRSGKKRETLLSKGDNKLLVVPIYFTDSDVSTLEAKTTFIQNAFFGRSDHTTYDSVAGYYNKSSYGQLKISGEVAPWYNLGIDSSEWKTKINSIYMTASSIIVSKAVDYLKENNLINASDYDLDEDGYIDAVYAIYDHPFYFNGDDNVKENTDNLFWAYTYYTFEGENGYNNISPYVNNYSWTSVNPIIQKDNRSYTNYLIHETGHLLGLSDYYNTHYSPDEHGGRDYHYQPTGQFDMMDYNIGDHSAFSKYLLNWLSPKVVKKGIEATIKLKPFVDSGECLLVPSNKYNNSPFSEYLMIEYFTPTGLNKYTGQYNYIDKNGNRGIYTYPQHHGLRIYHVNATIGYYIKGSSNNVLLATLDDPNYKEKIAGKNVGLDYAYDNSLSDAKAASGAPVFYHLLESSGKNTFKDAIPANNDTLFKLGDDFGITTFKDFTFNDGSKANFTLKITHISTKEITLQISTK